MHPPKLANRHIHVLLYADDAVLLSRTPIGLKRALKKFSQFSDTEHLLTNYQKTKILAFGKNPKIRRWELQGHQLEQLTSFKYLGVVLQASGTKTTHSSFIADVGEKTAHGILKFYRSQGGQYVPAALRLFKAKPLAQLVYGSFLGLPSSSFSQLERVHSKFLSALLQVPKCMPNSWVRLETGMLRVEARITILSIFKWLSGRLNPQGLLPLLFQDKFQSNWQKATLKSLGKLGLSPQSLLVMGLDRAKSLIKQRVTDIERQTFSKSTRFYFFRYY